MPGDSIQLVVVTPVSQLLSEAVNDVTLPGADGYLGVLPGHAPLITELGIGELTYKTAAGQSGLLAVIRGFARKSADGIGNFWADVVRCTLYILLPIAFVGALVFIAMGAIVAIVVCVVVAHAARRG